MIEDDEQRPDDTGEDAGADGVLAQAGPDLALLHDPERDRQRAGLEGEREVLGLLQGCAPRA